MRVLITWGSKLGGTAGIAAMLGETLKARGIEVVAVPAREAPSPIAFDAVIVGGALYANRWHRDARRFIERHARELTRIPTWLFSSGPLDDSADAEILAPPRPVRALIERVGAVGHATFGGRLEPGVKGFPAAAMAKEHAGDWRNPPRIRAWAAEIADMLPTARPRPAETPIGRSSLRVVEYGVVGWALAAATLVLATVIAPRWFALTLHAIVMAGWFASLSARYQRVTGARSPAAVAAIWVGITGVLDLTFVAPMLRDKLALATSVSGLWLPLALSFFAIWGAGTIGATLPMRTPVGAHR